MKKLYEINELINRATAAGLKGWETSDKYRESISSRLTMSLLSEKDKRLLELNFLRSLMSTSDGVMNYSSTVPLKSFFHKKKRDKVVLYEILSLVVMEDGSIVKEVRTMQYCKAFGSNLLSWKVKEDYGDYEIRHLPNNELIVVAALSNKDSLAATRELVLNGYEDWEYLPSSNAQTRTNSAWFCKKMVGSENFMNSITNGRWNRIKGNTVKVAKIAKYFGLIYTSTNEVRIGRPIATKFINGAFLIKSDRTKHELADGDTICSASFAEELATKMYGKDSPEVKAVRMGFGIQIRIGAQVKGMLYAIPDKLWNTRFKGYDLILTGSTLKVGGPNDLPKELDHGIIHVANVFDTDKQDKDLTFMFTQNMLNSNNSYNDAKAIVDKHIGYELKDMLNALENQTAFMKYFNVLSSEGIDLQEALKAIVGNYPNALKDELVFRSAKNQFKFRLDQLKEGKLRGCFLRCLLTDPSVWFLGEYNGEEIIYDENSIKECLIQPGQIFSRTKGKRLLMARSPSNVDGQMVPVDNIRYNIDDRVTINGVAVLTSELFGTDSKLANFSFLCGYDDTRFLLAGADTDGDTEKEMILVPGEDLIKEFKGDEEAISKYVGPWRELWAPAKGFIAIGDTQFKAKEVPFSYEALKECKSNSLIPDNTGIITNNLFALDDFYATLFYSRSIKDVNEVINGNMLYVLARMAYNADIAINGNTKQDSLMSEFKRLYDPEIVTLIESMSSYIKVLKELDIYNLMLNKKIERVRKVFIENKDVVIAWKRATMSYLRNCIELFAHLQMIQIDAASTGNYPNLDMFNFARLAQTQQTSNPDGSTEKVLIRVEPTWFCHVKERKYPLGVFKSRSVQGMIFNSVCEAEKKLKEAKLDAPVRLFSDLDNEAQTDVEEFTNNLVQAEMLKSMFIKSHHLDAETLKEKLKEENKRVKKYMSIKAEKILKKYTINDVVKAAYKISLNSLRKEEEGSATRASMFLRYFGAYAAALLKKDGDTIVCAIKDCRPVEGMLKATNGVIINGMNVVGYISCKDDLEGYIKNDMFIAKPVVKSIVTSRMLITEQVSDTDVLSVRTEIKDNRPVVSLFKGEKRVAEALHRFYAVMAQLNGKKVTLKVIPSENKTKNCEITVL